ncbi:MAG: N-acetylneuraminate synthase family protein, partial [Candidatus Micrarchaeia archaeon]
MPIGFKIGSHAIGPGNPVFIIAEAGVNHNGDLGLAKQLVDVAAKSGADAVKFQTFDADELASESAEKAEYQKKNDSRHKNQNEMLKSLQLSEQDFKVLKNYCSEKRIIFLSTPFDIKSANLLESLGVAAYKISSGEITNVPLLRHIAKFGKPIILSTGMADLAEVEKAVKLLKKEGNNDLVLLHCTTSYPAPSESLNLRAIQTLEKKFKTAVGFSDHSQGVIAPIVAIGLGACVIEKHFTLDKTLPGPDHVASLEPAELAAMV